MGSRRAIYNDLATSTSVFCRPRQKKSLGQGRALGNFFASDDKKPRFRVYIVVYSPPRPHIYITYIICIVYTLTLQITVTVTNRHVLINYAL